MEIYGKRGKTLLTSHCGTFYVNLGTLGVNWCKVLHSVDLVMILDV